ncbi:type IX secretion system membrane protein PorP/SprF [Aureispira sp. CCB-E]|uniref:PorP/SprF family type IX secretion system membrane protein n=1 Tax=Aureispira sp. CCB-E TaxID=3051121 RepID=UPI00286954EB|nr:type IX secretion system membrane protein PorP/SprF [Aureispira sp. CCB-E]WMX16116.1 type IX secretion system membrane protein PorP/SprF [Aureispira sp. CCB-E]
MKKYIYLSLCACLLSFNSQGQQDIQYTQFMFNKLSFNPAYAGAKSSFLLSAIYRKQWVGINRAPQTITLNGHGAVLKKKLGLGLSLSYDEIGFSNRVNIETSYAYIIRFKNESFLSLGLRGSMYYTQIRWDQADLIDNFDAAIPQSTTSRILPNFGAGAYYQAKNWYLGLSVPHIFVNEGDFNIVASNGAVEPEFTQHYYMMGGFIFDLSKKVQVQQNLLLKYVVNAPLAIDINLSFVFVHRVLFGVTYRVGSSISAIVQIQVAPQLRIAAAYDYSTNALREYNSGSIEMMMSYWFIKRKKIGELYNERFF